MGLCNSSEAVVATLSGLVAGEESSSDLVAILVLNNFSSELVRAQSSSTHSSSVLAPIVLLNLKLHTHTELETVVLLNS